MVSTLGKVPSARPVNPMADERIFVVEDEHEIRELLEYRLTREGFRVSTADNGVAALDAIRRESPDLVLLDLMLPGIDGLEICRALKQDEDTKGISIIMVTAKTEEADIVLGLGLGADDYILKPFSPREIVARVKAVLRRTRPTEEPGEAGNVVTRGKLKIDPTRFRVTVDDEELQFTATEFKMLHYLAKNPGRVFTRSQLMEVARGDDSVAFERAVDAHIRTVRKKLGPLRDLIQTVRSIGYRFAETAS